MKKRLRIGAMLVVASVVVAPAAGAAGTAGTSPSRVAAVVAPIDGATRSVTTFDAEGRELVVVTDTTVERGVAVAHMTIVDSATRTVVTRNVGVTAVDDAPERSHEGPQPYIKGRGIDQQSCIPAHTTSHEDEDCMARKRAAGLAADAICANAVGIGVFGGPWGAVAAGLACLAAQRAADSITCDPIVVFVPEFCHRVYPEPVRPEAQRAREEYKRNTGKEPPDPCDSRKSKAVTDEIPRPAVCE